MLDASTYSFSRSRGPAVVKGTAIVDEACVCCAHHVSPRPLAEGTVGLSVGGEHGFKHQPAAAADCQRHNGAQRCIIPSFSFARSLTSANINAPFCVLFLLSGVAKVITAYCLLGWPQC